MKTSDTINKSKVTNDDPLLNTPEAAAYIHRSPYFLEKARWAGYPVIPFIKIGRGVVYRKSSLEAFLQKMTRTSTTHRENEK